MSAQFQTCWPAAGFGSSSRLRFLFSCSEMHVDTCIACILQASTPLFFRPLRYCQFYGQDEFCRYNMFNHHFFDDEEAVTFFQGFLREEEGAKVVMITDPPFGGLVKPLANSFSQMSITWRIQNKVSDAGQMPMIWIFPYFFESRILECFPSFSMLDYQVDYDNHPLYKHGKTGRKQSPVRLFTNLSPKDIALPEDEGYRFCSVCERYVSAGNKHCPKCDTCPSKDGREWKHCDECGRCVKPSWRHCSSCGHCALPDHPCGQSQTGCFNCGSQKHKLRACPKKHNKRLIVPGGRGAPGLLKHTAGKSTTKNKRRWTDTRTVHYRMGFGCWKLHHDNKQCDHRVWNS